LIELNIVDDGVAEGDETVELLLTAANGAAIAAKDRLTVTLKDGTGVNTAPSANAGASRTVNAGTSVTLDGSASTDSDGDALGYRWRQLIGPDVALSSSTTASVTFAAPQVGSDTLLRFELTVSDPTGATDTATVSVTVAASASSDSANGSGGGAAGPWLLAMLLSIGALVRLRPGRYADGITRTDAA
jgi:hypothetical protein